METFGILPPSQFPFSYRGLADLRSASPHKFTPMLGVPLNRNAQVRFLGWLVVCSRPVNAVVRPALESSPEAINSMHWAPIPIAEFDIPPLPFGYDLAKDDVFRLLCRAPRRGFWLTAVAMPVLLAIGLVAIRVGFPLLGVTCFVFAVGAGTGNLLIRHKLNAALWISREPASVYWAAPIRWGRTTKYLLTLHTPGPVQLDAILTHDELIGFVYWLRKGNPDALIGSYSPNDSDGRLSGNDPWSPQSSSRPSANLIHDP